MALPSGIGGSSVRAHLFGQRLCEEASAEGIRKDVAPESVEDFPIVADEDDIALLPDDVATACQGSVIALAPPAKIARSPVKISRPLGCAGSSGIDEGAEK